MYFHYFLSAFNCIALASFSKALPAESALSLAQNAALPPSKRSQFTAISNKPE